MYFYYLISLPLLLLGLITGSFLNVLIYKLENKKRQSLFGRSFCPHCEHQIKWYDNIPVVSWLVLRGKCRNCKKKISIQYPLVELATGLVFSTISLKFLPLIAPTLALFDSGQARMTHTLFQNAGHVEVGILGLAFWLFFTACLIVIFVYDLKYEIIPDEIIYSALIGGLVFVFLNFVFLWDYKYLIDHMISALAAGGFFYALAAVSSGKWMGGGDIKLVAFMGLVLGWKNLIFSLYIAFILGALVGTILLIIKNKKMSSKIAFGPFLIIGLFAAILFGEKIVNFYVNMFL